MARWPQWVLGNVIWGDKVAQASQFADDGNLHTHPQASDYDFNALQADYLSQTDAIAQALASALSIIPSSDVVPLTLRGFLSGVSDLFDVKDGSGVKQTYVDNLGDFITLQRLGAGLAPAAGTQHQFSYPGGTSLGSGTRTLFSLNRNIAKPGVINSTLIDLGVTGSYDLNALTGLNLFGLSFSGIISNTNVSGATISTMDAIRGAPTIQTGNPITATNWNVIHATRGGFSGVGLTATTVRGLFVDNLVNIGTVGTTVGVDIAAQNALTGAIIGVREQSGGTNRINSPTRVGDQNIPNIGLEAAKGFGVNVQSQNANYQMLVTDYAVLATGGVGGITVTLPAANAGGTGIGQKVVVIKSDAGVGVVTVASAGTDTIEGAANKSLATQYQKAELISDNSGVWYDLGTGVI